MKHNFILSQLNKRSFEVINKIRKVAVLIFMIGVFSGLFMPSETSASAYAKKIEGPPNGGLMIGAPGDDKISSWGGNDINLGDVSAGDGSGDDKISSWGGNDINTGDTVEGFGSGDDKIKSGKGDDINYGDAYEGEGSGDDKINSWQGNDKLTGNGGADKFQCGSGDDTFYGFNPDEGDKATGNCEHLIP